MRFPFMMAALLKNLAANSMSDVARYRSQLMNGIRSRRRSISGSSTYWDGKAWSPVPRKPRVGRWENRSRKRAYAEKVSKGEIERREANWRKSKVGRAVLKRRREGRYPTVQSAEAIREAVEEKRHLTACRRIYRRGGASFLSRLDPTICPDHDLGLDVPVEHCICPEP
jgi:hypothetical protein